MGHQVIKQPDGLYAIFSSFTDSWILYDATRQDDAGNLVCPMDGQVVLAVDSGRLEEQ